MGGMKRTPEVVPGTSKQRDVGLPKTENAANG